MKNLFPFLLILVLVLQFFASCSSSKLACPTFNSDNSNSFVSNKGKDKQADVVWKRITPGQKSATFISANEVPQNNPSQVVATVPTLPTLNNSTELFADAGEMPSTAALSSPNRYLNQSASVVSQNEVEEKATSVKNKQLQRIENMMLKKMPKTMAKVEKRQAKYKAIQVEAVAAGRNSRADKFAIAGGVLGILSLVLPYLGLAAAICGVVLGVLALKQGTSRRGLAIAGIICGAIGLFFFFLVYGLAFGLFPFASL